MAFKHETIRYYCELAKLGIPDEGIDSMQASLNEIAGRLDILRKLADKDIKPLINISEGSNVFRQDEVKNSLEREKILSNAPESENGCYSVPKLVE